MFSYLYVLGKHSQTERRDEAPIASDIVSIDHTNY